jgi:hypothetical protein
VLGLSVGSLPEIIEVAGEAVLLSHRFDQAENMRILSVDHVDNGPG